jgi:hypothetical protein
LGILRIENRKLKFFSLFSNWQQLPKNKNNFYFIFIFFSRVCLDATRPSGLQTVSAGEGGGGMSAFARTVGCVHADVSVLRPCNFITDATVHPSHGRPSGHCPIVCPSVRLSVRYRPRDNPGRVHFARRTMSITSDRQRSRRAADSRSEPPQGLTIEHFLGVH